MSLFTLAGRAVQAESESPVNRAQARAMAEAHAMAEADAKPEPSPAVSTALQRLVDFIPTERSPFTGSPCPRRRACPPS